MEKSLTTNEWRRKQVFLVRSAATGAFSHFLSPFSDPCA
jgi:hypothetical protein